MKPEFVKQMEGGYRLPEPSLIIGSALLDNEPLNDPRVQVALSVLNRHGLVAGATGTGKTKTLQVLAGQLSDAGTPVFVADVKGDLTGLTSPGDASNPKVQERCSQMAWDFKPAAHAVEFLSLSGKLGAQVRATVHSFGPVLLGKVMDLNETQTSILSLIFKYCDDNRMPLLDLADLRTTLQFLSSDAGKPILADYGGMSPASVGVLLRSLVNLEQAGADAFFGEPEFDVNDLLRTTLDGRGIVTLLATLALVVPGIIVFCGYSVAGQVAALEPLNSSTDALRRSWDLTKGFKGKAFVLWIVSFALLFVVVLGAGALGAAAGALAGGLDATVTVLIALVSLLIYPLITCVFTLLYYDLRVRKEGFDLEVLSSQLGSRSGP